MKNHLLVIDPQNSFCDPKGELFVPGADKDMTRLARFIDNRGDSLDRITVTLDSHNRMHIAHPAWWLDQDGKHPAPFTVISADDVRMGLYRTTHPEDAGWSLKYLMHTIPHVIWPMHCLIGTWGHQVYEPLSRSLTRWADKHTELDFLIKGTSRNTEHFSAIKASMLVPDDPCTQTDKFRVGMMARADQILVAGEATSHCVSETVKDMIALNPLLISKIILLTDCMSQVAGFEDLAGEFFETMKDRGVKTADSETVVL